MDKIAVLIPCYNEEQTISKVVGDVKATLPEATIYVYDNNSTDGSDKIAKKAGAIVRYEKKQGKGNVIRTMFREIDADCYIMVDADDTYDISNISDGSKMVPYLKIEPTSVTKSNIDEVIIKSGFHLKEDVYLNVPDEMSD